MFLKRQAPALRRAGHESPWRPFLSGISAVTLWGVNICTELAGPAEQRLLHPRASAALLAEKRLLMSPNTLAPPAGYASGPQNESRIPNDA